MTTENKDMKPGEIPEWVWTSDVVMGWCDSAGCESVGHKGNACKLAVAFAAHLPAASQKNADKCDGPIATPIATSIETGSNPVAIAPRPADCECADIDDNHEADKADAAEAREALAAVRGGSK